MIYIKLFGGLGNQLFQYAYGRYLGDHGQAVKYIVKLRSSGLVDVFETNQSEIAACRNEFGLAMRKAYAKFFASEYLTGFYQLPEYAEVVRADLHFLRYQEYIATPFYAEIVGEAKSVGIHVRGGDYLDKGGYKQFGSVCDRDYYQRAIACIESRIAHPRYFVFTNDREHAERVLPSGLVKESAFRGDKGFESDPGFDLFLMSRCANNIIANSTYSWWGSFLNERTGQIVVAPGKWIEGICPKSWILV